MKNGTMAILFTLLILGGSILAAVSNPSKAEYTDWTVNRITGMADPGLIKAVIVSSLRPIVDASTSRTDYVVCSVYDFSIPGYSSRTLGIFGNFNTLQEDNSFKNAIEKIMQTGSINEKQVMDAAVNAVTVAKEAVAQVLPPTSGDIVNGYSVDDLRNRLQFNGNSESIDEAFWIMDQGDAVLPAVNTLLYAPNPADFTGAYPYNVFFALSQFNGAAVKEVLIHHSENPLALLALDAVEAREKNASYRIIIEDTNMCKAADYQSDIVAALKPGVAVALLESKIETPNVEGPMGGPSVYDYIQIIKTGQTGYVERVGGGFAPFW